ncbi:TetR family transcriptional regulator [Russula earlei]|uniref:TetR family transcriptional regulator n=1 Tax=Russula earlei TaxID=71964 RepID=A0ACC0TXE6_9AGAM|nr:TetR family transcriptional regulator [Russula earlei]
MGIAERKLRQKETIRAGILASAWQIVQSEGWQSLSIRKIADSIEYSVPVVYNHFESKDAILMEFIRQGFNILSTQLQEAKTATSHPPEQLKAIAGAYWQFALSHKPHYEVMFGLGIPGCEAVKQMEEMKKVSEAMLSAIEKTISAGNSPQADPYLKLHTYWSILHGFVSIQMFSGYQPMVPRKLILEDAVESFIKGIMA